MQRKMARRLDAFIEYLSERFLKRVCIVCFFSALLAAAVDLVAAVFNLWKREVVVGFVMSCGGVVFGVTLAVLFGAIACRNALDMWRDNAPRLGRLWGISSITGPLLFCMVFLSGAFAALRAFWKFW